MTGPSPSYKDNDAEARPAEGPSTVPDDLDWSLLMARAQGGDRDAYRRLLEAIVPYLRSLVLRHQRNFADVEDAVQDILLTLHAIRHTYDPARPFTPWLVAIARRRIVDRLRRQMRFASREVVLDPGHETFAAPGSNLQEAAWNRRTLRKAMDRLPAGQRQAVMLLKLQEMSLKEAAVASGQSVPALKVARHRALKNLRRLVGSWGGET
jgi:RNA polymerase sigma-70 factor (ECF subfamily)